MGNISLNIGGVPEHFNIPWYQAIEKGLFEQEGINLDWKDYPGGTGAMVKDLRNGTLDVAVLLTEGIVADIVNGNPSKIIQVYVDSPLLWAIHVPAHSSFNYVEELEGKRYAISRRGSGSHLMAFVDATQRGWDPAGLELVLVGGLDGARQAFRENKADVFMWEKFMTKSLVDKGEFRRIGETPTPWPCFVIAAREEIIAKQTPALQKLLQVINQSTQKFMANKTESLAAITERFQLQPDDAATWFASTRWSKEGEVSTGMLQEVINTLYNLRIIDQLPDPAIIKATLNAGSI